MIPANRVRCWEKLGFDAVLFTLCIIDVLRTFVYDVSSALCSLGMIEAIMSLPAVLYDAVLSMPSGLRQILTVTMGYHALRIALLLFREEGGEKRPRPITY